MFKPTVVLSVNVCSDGDSEAGSGKTVPRHPAKKLNQSQLFLQIDAMWQDTVGQDEASKQYSAGLRKYIILTYLKFFIFQNIVTQL